MFGFGIEGIVIGVVGALFLAWLWRRGPRVQVNVAGPALVLRRFDLSEAPRDGVFLRIVGRTSGLLGWLMTLLRLEVETTIEVTQERFSIRFASLSSHGQDFAPLLGICSAHCGYFRPVWMLVTGAVLLLTGVIAGLQNESGAIVLVGLVVGAAFLIDYWLSRKLRIWVQTSGGMQLGMVFKPSVIEGVSLDMNRAVQAVALVNKKLLEAYKGVRVGTQGGVSEHKSPADAAGRMKCQSCGSLLAGDARFCVECGACLVSS